MIKELNTYINYPKLVEDAMKEIVKKLLKQAVVEGLQGSHYFLLTFLTRVKGVVLSNRLIKKYPSEMTIILQHQYEDLQVTDTTLSVRLSFDGIKETVTIPISALTAFVDPSTRFALQFHPSLDDENDTKTAKDQEEEEVNSNVISLDKFRKKKK
ncbi:MAG: ClpXP protease specificity-enhancing factor SspB [Rickettsiaceae bacterium]|nr:ClpXP protease specificity-enhancing factor SspB [Rickettsiaceae bacterium]